MQKPDTHYWRHRPTLFDELPLEVIRDIIFPYLDYESRIVTNQLLPRWDRIHRKIPEAQKHDWDLRSKNMSAIMRRGNASHGDKKLDAFTKLYKTIRTPPYLSLITSNQGLRAAVSAKTKMLCNYKNYPPNSYSVRAVHEMVMNVRKMRDTMAELDLMA